MSSMIGKRELEHLARLARIELEPNEEEKLLKHLEAILDHIKELQTLDTANVPPMTGGTALVNALREDTERENTNQGAGVESFPEEKEGYLAIPPVFE